VLHMHSLQLQLFRVEGIQPPPLVVEFTLQCLCLCMQAQRSCLQ
jgi:hypothetical protein